MRAETKQALLTDVERMRNDLQQLIDTMTQRRKQRSKVRQCKCEIAQKVNS